MKVIVDTCVWSLVLRRRAGAPLTGEEMKLIEVVGDALTKNLLAMVGPIRQEILSGIKEKQIFERVKSKLSALPDEVLEEEDYIEAARISNFCRTKGIASGAIDILLCAVATRRSWKLLTTDKGLLRVMETLRKEKIYLMG